MVFVYSFILSFLLSWILILFINICENRGLFILRKWFFGKILLYFFFGVFNDLIILIWLKLGLFIFNWLFVVGLCNFNLV